MRNLRRYIASVIILFLPAIFLYGDTMSVGVNVTGPPSTYGNNYGIGTTVYFAATWDCSGWPDGWDFDWGFGEGNDPDPESQQYSTAGHAYSTSGEHSATVTVSGHDKTGTGSTDVTIVEVTDLDGPAYAACDNPTATGYETDNCTYTVTTNPTGTSCDQIAWSGWGEGNPYYRPFNNTEPLPENGFLSWTTKYSGSGRKWIRVTCGSQKEMLTHVFRPDLCAEGISEDAEEETGIYVGVGNSKRVKVCISGSVPDGTQVTLIWDSDKVSLFDRVNWNIAVSPYTFTWNESQWCWDGRDFDVYGVSPSTDYITEEVLGSTDTIKVNVFRPNIVLHAVTEELEESQGSFVQVGKTITGYVEIEGNLPVGTKIYLSCPGGHNFLSYFDGIGTDSPIMSFPQDSYTYYYQPGFHKYLTARGDRAVLSYGTTTTLSTELGGGDTAKTTVFHLDIDPYLKYYDYHEGFEMETGLMIPLNDDDDNTDAILDKDEHPVFGDNELEMLYVKPPIPPNLPGNVTLTYSGTLELWENTNKETYALTNISISDQLQSNRSIWAEGIHTSGAMRDSNITLHYTAPDGSTGSDSVLATVYGVNLSMQYVPETLEENPGAYIPLGETRIVTLDCGPKEPGTVLTLYQDGGNRLTLYDAVTGETEAFPYTYTCDVNHTLPHTMIVKGTNCSSSVRDATLRLTALGLTDTIKVTVYSLDVILNQMSEAVEEDTGCFIPLNDDDDNGNWTPDKNEYSVSGENDLCSAQLICLPADLGGTVNLTWSGILKIWNSSTKGTEITSLSCSPGQLPQWVYVEGYNCSGGLRDAELTINYTGPAGSDSDKAKMTVYTVDLDWAGVSDDAEYETGIFIPRNDDDDDYDKIIDLNEVPPLDYPIDDDLRQLIIQPTIPAGLSGILTLSPGSNTSMWDYETKQAHIQTIYDAADIGEGGINIFVQGNMPSTDLRDVEYYITFTPAYNGLPKEDHVKATVYQIDLDWQEIASEEAELETGLFIPLNNDNDDIDTWLDYNSSDTYVPGENETKKLIIRSLKPSAMLQFPGVMEFSRYTSHTKSWSDSTKSSEVVITPQPLILNIPDDLQDDTSVWIEGTSCSSMPRDEIYWIQYQAPCVGILKRTIRATIYRPDLVVCGVDEAVEDETGAFIRKDNTRIIYINAEGYIPPGMVFTLSLESGSVELYDGEGTETQLSFPYQYTYNSANPLPKTLTIKGTTLSSSCRDIGLKLSALNVEDNAKVTVFSIDLDWDDSYGLSEAAEIDTGLFIPVNDDNDDTDSWLDYDPADTSVAGENETRKLIIRPPQPSDLPGNINYSADLNCTVTWESQTKEVEIGSCELDVAQELQNDYPLWVEGTNTSYYTRDTEFRIIYVAPDGETADDTVLATVFRPDIMVGTLDEEAEEETGAFIEKGKPRQVTISCEGGIPYGTALTLSSNNAKLSLYEGDGTETPLSLPYVYTYDETHPLPKILTVKGESESANTKDTIPTLEVFDAEDRARVTVFSIDVDWDDSYGLSEEAEVETGLYIPLNDDDDNSDTAYDKDENPVYGENDLMKAIVRSPLPVDLPGGVALSTTYALQLWQDTPGDTEKIAQAPATYSISDDLQSDTVIWTEGIHTSAVMRDNFVTLSYTAPDGTTAADSIVATIAGPNLTVANVAEATEEETGAYIRLDKTRSITIDVVGPVNIGDTLTLTQEGGNHLALYEDVGMETQLSFPYEYEYNGSNLPKQLIVRGENCSTSNKDITLKLSLQNGGVDRVRATVYDIDVDWHPEYQLDEEAEVETGLNVPLNDDDDNTDTTLDKDEHPVYLENDLKKLLVRIPVPADLPGNLAITSTSALKLWEDANEDTQKQTEASAVYSITADLQTDRQLLSEGIHTSGAMRDNNVTISYTALDGTTETDSIVATITGPNLILTGVDETDEETPGGYMRLGKTRSISIDAVGPYEYGAVFTLYGDAKVSLYEGIGTDTPLNFPYSYTYDGTHPLPKVLTIRGESCSSADKDITLRLTDPSGDEDRVRMTVYNIDLDWDGTYNLSETAEKETGLYMPLNDDDDNEDTTLDKDENPVQGENDLRQVWIRVPEPADLPGELSVESPGTIVLWEDTGADTLMKQGLAETTYSIADSLQTDRCIQVEGVENSSAIKDSVITLSYTAPDGGTETDTVVATVVKLEITATPDAICAGGDDGNNLDICKSTITAKLTPAIANQTITFCIAGNRAIDQDESVTIYDVPAPFGNGWFGDGTGIETQLLTDEFGEETVILRSSRCASNNISDRIQFSVYVEASWSAMNKNAPIIYNPPVYTLDPYLDPSTMQRLDQLTLGGWCVNSFMAEYDNTPLPKHEISWSFKFWTMETLNEASGGLFEDLSAEQQAYIFDTTMPDNININPFDRSVYGYLEQATNLTDETGVNTCIYQISVVEGYVEIKADDNSIRMGHTSAWEWITPFLDANKKDLGYVINLRLKNQSATVAEGTTTYYMKGREDKETGCGDDYKYEEEEQDGAEMRINANFDEDSQNKRVEDYLRPGIVKDGNDPDLLDGQLIIKNKAGRKVYGEWWLTFPGDKVNVWKKGQDDNVYSQVLSGSQYNIGNKPSTYNITLKVEGKDGSTATNDVKVKAFFKPKDVPQTETDLANITVVKTEFMLTFDDGPFKIQTMQVINIAKNIYVNGTRVKFGFFMVGTDGSGAFVPDNLSPKGSVQQNYDVAAKVKENQHIVCNHTNTHLHAWKNIGITPLTSEEYAPDIQACTNILDAHGIGLSGYYFRPPYWGRRYAIGDYNPNVTSACNGLGFKIVWGKSQLGDVAGQDWSTIATNTKNYLLKWNIKAMPLRKSRPTIICYHEYYSATSNDIGQIINHLRASGFLLKTIDFSNVADTQIYYDWTY